MGDIFSKDEVMLDGRNCRNRGFTATELLVVLSIISILIGLLLPAVQNARESARRLTCQNNLRQIGIAIAAHESTHRTLPGGGWGFTWVGDQRYGAGRSQPGGWIFQILPQLEQTALWNLSSTDKLAMIATPLNVLTCPSRGLDNPSTYRGEVPLVNAAIPTSSFRSDYAGNGGDAVLRSDAGPRDNAPRTIRDYRWSHLELATGIFFQFSLTKYRDVSDGLSMTYAVGEKHTLRSLLESRDFGHDQSALIGDDHDIRRTAASPPRRDSLNAASDSFGSSHDSVWNVLKLDGSVDSQSYEADFHVHRNLGNRSDGNHRVSAL